MTHSNVYPYPLPFPNEIQRAQLVMYMSPNAVGTPTHLNRQSPRTKCDPLTDPHRIYLNGPPPSNPSYPYPARNVFNPSTYPASTSSPKSPSNTSIVRENDAYKDRSRSLLGYDHLPQPQIMEPDRPYGCQAGAESLAIHFTRRENKQPYTLWDLLSMHTMPNLATGEAPILIRSPDRWIKVKLIWPGYSRYPFEKRIAINKNAPLTSSVLLMALAHHMEKFARWIQNEGIVVEPGYEHWRITGATGATPAMWRNCVITCLKHQTGSTWQPEIYYPRG